MSPPGGGLESDCLRPSRTLHCPILRLGGGTMLRPFALAISCVILGGCASTDRVDLVAGDSQQAIVRNGTPALVSQKRHLVMLSANSRAVKSNARPGFTVVIKNLGRQPETLMMSSFSASSRTSNQVAGIRIYQYELLKEEQTRQAWAAFGAALEGAGNAMSAASAGYVNTTGS